MYLIVTTPRFILGCDADSGKIDVLASGSRFYGLSWSLSGEELLVTHAGFDGNIEDLGDYAMAETGYVTIGRKRSWPCLNVPHQALWIDERYALVMNTGRNAIACIDAYTMAVVQTRYDAALWDRYDKTGAQGSHYNSLFFDGSDAYFVAHNFDRGAFILRARWPSLELVERCAVDCASGIHNLWIDERDRWIICDSNAGAIIDVKAGQRLWDCRGEGYTRGLAASDDRVFVGNSERGNRSAREFTETGIWVLDRATFELRDYILLGSFGGVHEIRIADRADACHHGVPLNRSALGVLDEWRERRRVEVRSIASSRIAGEQAWRLRFGRFESRDGVLVSVTGRLSLMTHRETEGVGDCVVGGRLHALGSSGSDHASLVVRYSGIEDDRMYAALFQVEKSGKLSASIWLQNGEWRCLAAATYASPDSSHGRRWPMEGIPVSFEARGSTLIVRASNTIVVEANDTTLTTGSAGIRVFGDGLGLGELEFAG